MPNNQIRMTEHFGFWSSEFFWILVLGIWLLSNERGDLWKKIF
jgi:hypothetical protein